MKKAYLTAAFLMLCLATNAALFSKKDAAAMSHQTVTGFSAKRSGNSYRLTWNAVADADHYVVSAGWTGNSAAECGDIEPPCGLSDHYNVGNRTSWTHSSYPADRSRSYVVVAYVRHDADGEITVIQDGYAWTAPENTTPEPTPTNQRPVSVSEAKQINGSTGPEPPVTVGSPATNNAKFCRQDWPAHVCGCVDTGGNGGRWMTFIKIYRSVPPGTPTPSPKLVCQ